MEKNRDEGDLKYFKFVYWKGELCNEKQKSENWAVLSILAI